MRAQKESSELITTEKVSSKLWTSEATKICLKLTKVASYVGARGVKPSLLTEASIKAIRQLYFITLNLEAFGKNFYVKDVHDRDYLRFEHSSKWWIDTTLTDREHVWFPLEDFTLLSLCTPLPSRLSAMSLHSGAVNTDSSTEPQHGDSLSPQPDA